MYLWFQSCPRHLDFQTIFFFFCVYVLLYFLFFSCFFFLLLFVRRIYILFLLWMWWWSLSVTKSFLLVFVRRIFFLLLRCMCSLCFYCNFFSSFFLCVRRTMNANLQTNTSAGPQKCTQIKIHSFWSLNLLSTTMSCFLYSNKITTYLFYWKIQWDYLSYFCI